jgi:cardiolipin synthase
MTLAFYVFLLSGISDGLDGLIAKQFNLVTRLGKYLDPIADKILLVSIYVTLGIKEDIESWLVILVVSRDIMIVGGIIFSYLMGFRIAIKPVLVSKANTFFQILLATLILASEAFDLHMGIVITANVYIVAATTVLSGYTYVSMWISQNNAR